MRILLPTGTATEAIVRKAAAGFDADVVVTGEIASFLTPHALHCLMQKRTYDSVIVSGMCTASFDGVERETGIPIYRGPRHAADLSLVLPLIGTEIISRTVPADDFLIAKRAEQARHQILDQEEAAGSEYLIRGMKIGGGSRMKVLAERICIRLLNSTSQPGRILLTLDLVSMPPRVTSGRFFPGSMGLIALLPWTHRIPP
jgi:hypothetical protein